MLETEGAAPVADVVNLAKKATVILTSLPGPIDIQALAFGGPRLVEHLRAGSLWIDTSTNDPTVARALGEAVEAHGAMFVDAPVTGGVEGARAGTLKFMAGASADALVRARPVLDVIGARIVHTGPVGTGCAMKLVVNFLGIAHTALAAEALIFGRAVGLDSDRMLSTVIGSWGENAMLRDTIETASTGHWGFARHLALKDI